MVENKETKKATTQMNFHCIYKLNFRNRDPETLKNVADEFNSLPKFKKGTPTKIGEGFEEFEDFNIESFIVKPPMFKRDKNNPKKTKEMKFEKHISNKNILTKRFLYEVYIEGRTEAQHREADLFWIKPCDVLLVKGGKVACEKVSQYLLKFINVGFKEIDFDHEFLLWLLYRFDQFEGKLSGDLTIQKIDKGRTHGISTNENDISFRDGQSRVIPFTTVYGLLNDHKLFHIGGDYQFRDHKINAKLATDISIFIYADHSLRKKTYAEKCTMSFPFIIEIVEIFEKWTDMSNEDKYPNNDFFDSTINSFKKQMEYSLEGIDDLREKYKNLRKSSGVKDDS